MKDKPADQNTHKGWSPERRKKQSETIRKSKPWQHATGPKTTPGKERSKYNALKHGMRSAEAENLRNLLNLQKLYLEHILEVQKNKE